MTSTSTTTNLVFRHVFGTANGVADNVAYLDDTRVAYVAGHSLVVFDKSANRQTSMQGSEIADTITAMTVSTTKKHAAIAEKGDRPKIHIFDIAASRLKKTLTVSDIKAKELVCLQFSEDDQTLLSLSGFPDAHLMCWAWAKGKLVASLLVSQGAHVTRCSLNPAAREPLACVSGKDCVKFFRITDRTVRLIKDVSLEGMTFTCHIWLREQYSFDCVIAATEGGDLVVFRSGEFICRLDCSPGPTFPATYIIATTTGFVVGSKQGTLLVVLFKAANYQVRDDRIRGSSHNEDDRATIDLMVFQSQFSVVNLIKTDITSASITCLAISPSESTMTVLFTDNNLLTMPSDALSSATGNSFQHLSCSFHEPKLILGLDVCVKKPLILSCATDCTLRLWNFVSNSLVIQKRFLEEMLSVALHPTGLHCVLGFIDRLSVFHILVDDLKLCLELPIKNCRECRFSKGGNLIAAVNGNSILIYDFYAGKKIADLKGHNGKVRSLHWLESGNELLSCGQDGAIYLWDIDGNKRTGEFLKKGVMYTSVVHGGASGGVFGVGSDRLMKELSSVDLNWVKDIDSGGVVLNQLAICHSKNCLLASTSEPGRPGCIRVYRYPILDGEYTEYIVGSAITRLAMTPDESFVVVADESGSIFVYEIYDRPHKGARRAGLETTTYSELIVVDNWSDEVLIPRNDLEERAHIIQDLKIKLREQKFQNDFKLKLKDTAYLEHSKEVTEAFVRDIEVARVKLHMSHEGKSKSEGKCVESLKEQSDGYQALTQQCETRFQAELMSRVDVYHELMHRRDEQRESLDSQRRRLKMAHEKLIAEFIRENEASIQEAVSLRGAAAMKKTELMRNAGETEGQIEDDIDTEIDNMSKVFTSKLSVSRENSMKYKGWLGVHKKKCVVIQNEMKELRAVMAQLYEKERELHDQIIALEKEIAIHKKEIKARDFSIGEKEKRVYELKKKNQELDKFKFVLDFKIRELKQQIEPRQKEINEMKDKIKEMDKSLENYHNSNAELDHTIGSIRKKIEDLQRDIKHVRMEAKRHENTIGNFRTDVNQSVAFILVPDRLKMAVDHILKTYLSDSDAPLKVEEVVEGEYDRHKDFLQKSVGQIKIALSEEVNARMATNSKLMHDNMGIINDINKQRNVNRLLKMAIQADMGRIRHTASKKKKTGSKRLKITFDDMSETSECEPDPALLMERNRGRIDAIRLAISSLQSSVVQRSYSREILPPMDSVGVPATVGEGELP